MDAAGSQERLVPGEPFESIARTIDPRAALIGVTALDGGTSATISLLTLRDVAGKAERYVVRQYGDRDLAQDARVASKEYALTSRLFALGLPVPEPVLHEAEREKPGAPYLVQRFIEGRDFSVTPEDLDFGQPMAEALLQIHRIVGSDLTGVGLPDAWTQVKIAIEANGGASATWNLLHGLVPRVESSPSVLLHGDYWHGNIRWNSTGIAGIIDWEDAAIGDSLQDVANAEFELILAGRKGDASRFLDTYQGSDAIDPPRLDYWRLYAAARAIDSIPRWGLSVEETAHALTTARSFAAKVAERLQFSDGS